MASRPSTTKWSARSIAIARSTILSRNGLPRSGRRILSSGGRWSRVVSTGCGSGKGSQLSQRRQRYQRTPSISRRTSASSGRISRTSRPTSSCPSTPQASSSQWNLGTKRRGFSPTLTPGSWEEESMVLEGLMQNDYPLTVKHVLDRVRRFGADSEVVTLKGPDDVRRARYPEVAARADKLASGLSKLGIGEGDRVGTFMWNNQEHFEAYLAIPSMGAVLNTVNIRLFPEQVTYIINHAKDRVLFVDDSLVEVLGKVAPQLETVEHFVVVGDGDAGDLPNVIRYEDLLAHGDDSFDYPQLDERQAAGLCYTSGTTGNPKGVLYSHRSTILHAFGHNSPDALGLRFSDRVLPIVPMFHVNAWGIPYGAGMTGASLVMPDRFLQGEPVARLLESEKVTCSAGVPTVWAGVLQYLDDNKID